MGKKEKIEKEGEGKKGKQQGMMTGIMYLGEMVEATRDIC